MLVLVDTGVWSLALRRKVEHLSAHEQGLISALRELIEAGRAQLMGAVRQELLSGIREEASFGNCVTSCAPLSTLPSTWLTTKKQPN